MCCLFPWTQVSDRAIGAEALSLFAAAEDFSTNKVRVVAGEPLVPAPRHVSVFTGASCCGRVAVRGRRDLLLAVVMRDLSSWLGGLVVVVDAGSHLGR